MEFQREQGEFVPLVRVGWLVYQHVHVFTLRVVNVLDDVEFFSKTLVLACLSLIETILDHLVLLLLKLVKLRDNINGQ